MIEHIGSKVLAGGGVGEAHDTRGVLLNDGLNDLGPAFELLLTPFVELEAHGVNATQAIRIVAAEELQDRACLGELDDQIGSIEAVIDTLAARGGNARDLPP